MRACMLDGLVDGWIDGWTGGRVDQITHECDCNNISDKSISEGRTQP